MFQDNTDILRLIMVNVPLEGWNSVHTPANSVKVRAQRILIAEERRVENF